MSLTASPPPDSPPSPAELRGAPFQLALLAAIVESSDDAIVSKTLEGRILSWNRGATRIFGYEPAEAIGKSITIIIPAELHDEETQILARLRQGERIDHFDTTRVTKDGRRIPVSLTVSPIRNADGVVIGASKIARDISERKQAEAALREADQRKDQFLALLAHELRNPLAPIRYALAASKKAGTVEVHRRTQAIIERQVTYMTRLLEDLLDIARITRGTLEIKKSATELTYIIGTAIETARPILNSKQHNLALDLPRHSVHLEADSTRLTQIFSNVLINAAKYTNPGGHIELRVATTGDQVEVAIRDDGIGISRELMPRLFDRYAQGREAFGRDEGGLGIGLSLVRGLVALHGGTVEARSDGPDRGSEFIIRLPIGRPFDQAPQPEFREDASADAGLNVLVVDDNRDAAEMCATLLEISGHHVKRAYSGAEALELAHALRPDVLLADIGLPDIDGFALARKIRTATWGSGIVLIAISGWGREDDQHRAIASGFDYHLTKPASAESIESILRSVSLTLDASRHDRRPEAHQLPS